MVTDLAILVENNLMATGGELPHLPTPKARDWKSGGGPGAANRKTPDLSAVSAYFPTPKASDSYLGRPRTSGRPIEKSTFLGTIVTLLPNPNTSDGTGGLGNQGREGGQNLRTAAALLPAPNGPDTSGGEQHNTETEWGKYEPAIRRWETINGPAPAPTELNTKGNPRLAAPFAEWMMGLPAGWITSEEIGLSRSQQLKAAGNGVCPQQATEALTRLGILDRLPATETVTTDGEEVNHDPA